jgi:hypothetical protein
MALDPTEEMLSLGERLCIRLRELASDLAKTGRWPAEPDGTLLLWRILLLAISADVGMSIIRLAVLADEDHSRAMRMLDRSLFEYGLRLEYYVHCPDDAVKHANNFRSWWGALLKASQVFSNPEALTPEERRQMNEIIKSMQALEIPAIRHMLLLVLTMNGYRGGDRKRLARWLLGHYYHIGSALIHGSQGAFSDFFSKNPETGAIAYTPKSVRFTVSDSLFNAALHLIEVLMAEEKHRKSSLASDMYARDLELSSGRWGIVEAMRTSGFFLRPK